MDYKEKIRQEARHWDSFFCNAYEKGDISMLDLRRDYLRSEEEGDLSPWLDPRTVEGGQVQSFFKESYLKDGDLLELGCGSGRNSLEFSRFGMRVVGVDIAEKALKLAESYDDKEQGMNFNDLDFNFLGLPVVVRNRKKVFYKKEDLNSLCMLPKRFDRVVAWDTVHHIENLDHLFKEIQKSLKPGGRLILRDHYGLGRFGEFVMQFLRRMKHVLVYRKFKEEVPFEDVSLGAEMIRIIRKYFKIKKLVYSRSLLQKVNYYIWRMTFLPKPLRKKIYYFLDKWDAILVKRKILKPEYFFVVAEV